MPRLTRSEQRQIVQNALRSLRGRRPSGGLFRELGRRYGPFGELLGMVADILGAGSRPGRRDLEQAVRLLTEEGFQVEPGMPLPPGHPPEPPVSQPAPPVARPRVPEPPPISRSGGRQQATRRPSRAPAEPWPAEHGVEILPARIRGAYDYIPTEYDEISPEIETPDSSNVYSIQYDYGEGVLYVRFKADAKPIGYKKMVSSCSGKPYKVSIRPHTPGPLYSYGGRGTRITPEQFQAFIEAASSGQWVWQNLRVCGSDWQHQVPYTLTSVPPGGNIPRKATRRGLRVRTVPTVGAGRRGGRKSTLPERLRD